MKNVGAVLLWFLALLVAVLVLFVQGMMLALFLRQRRSQRILRTANEALRRSETLLLETCGSGHLRTSSGGFICCRQSSGGTQIGPWGCLIGTQAGDLFDQVLTLGTDNVFLDVPAGNFAAASLLSQRGFSIKGSTLLMYLGDLPLYQPGSIYALASMGSMG